MTKYILIFLVYGLSFLTQNQYNVQSYHNLTVIPGQGLDSIKIGVSTRADIEKYLGKGRLEKRVFYYGCVRPKGKKKYTDPTLCFDSLGVEFTFNEMDAKNPINEIKLLNKTDWNINDEFKINQTTRKEVYDKYGLPPNGQNEVGYIYYDSLGIGFYFDYYNEQYNHKYLPTDTLINVLIYPKSLKQLLKYKLIKIQTTANS